jgi:hypothetical protein
MLNRELLIHNLEVRQAALKHLIDRDFTGNTLAVLEAWREVKWIKEAIMRGEYDYKSK